ncbi:hypothetical protein [Streptomonospora litoralis]|uniref:Lipoprotein n=1 Tax=Streptomonospora litoralis TaxID=2498135 RepID=A0A4P6Q5H7_9ACTN|nr:hypothetical protein [Streptomonospora litoralis]QBI55998.1 hypothetical protein EKD16_21210 [Streptomonospora litoralis]
MPATCPPSAAARASAALCALALLGGCAQNPEDTGGRGGAPEVEPPPSATAGMDPRSADPTVEPGTIFVFNTHGNEQGEADQRPKNLVASPSTTFTGLEWAGWGGGPALGTGQVQGTWCLPDCQDEPFAVSVELSGTETIDGTAFYTDYSFAGMGDIPEEMRGRLRDVDSGRLTLPSAW